MGADYFDENLNIGQQLGRKKDNCEREKKGQQFKAMPSTRTIQIMQDSKAFRMIPRILALIIGADGKRKKSELVSCSD